MNKTKTKANTKAKRPHWTQTAEGKRKLARAIRKSWSTRGHGSRADKAVARAKAKAGAKLVADPRPRLRVTALIYGPSGGDAGIILHREVATFRGLGEVVDHLYGLTFDGQADVEEVRIEWVRS